MDYDILITKKHALDQLRPLPHALVKNLEDWFTVELTYTSNAIEGNTLTRRETALVIEKGLTVGGKSLKEHIEATNHAHALEFVRDLVVKRPGKLNEQDLLEIHNLILKNIDDENAGHYRHVPVRISGSSVIMPNHLKVPDLMQDFITWLKSPTTLHPVAFAGEAHYRLVTIHPFVDGNGRTARLLMNLLLMMNGYVPAIIRKQDRLTYIESLETAQLGGSKATYEKLIFKAAERSLDIYLKAARGETPENNTDSISLLKIGAIAKLVGETIPTIRYWVKEGLVDVQDITPSGYQLFSPMMVSRCAEIKALKEKRYKISEIKEIIDSKKVS